MGRESIRPRNLWLQYVGQAAFVAVFEEAHTGLDGARAVDDVLNRGDLYRICCAL